VHRLFYGNFVLELAVPTKLVDLCLHREDREITHMPYYATTGDLNGFPAQNGFTLC
jgi:chitin synthase